MSERPPEPDPAEERLRRSIEAYHEAALLYAAVKLGLAEKMGGRSWTAEALAKALGLSAPHLARFLRGLCILGMCEERPGDSFALTPFGQSLTPDSHLGQKARIVVEQYWLPWANLIATLPTGTPAFDQIFGMDVFNWRRENASQGALFDSYLAKETSAHASAIVEALDLSGADTVAEIGGGYGAMLAATLSAHPHIAGVLFERQHKLDGARAYLQSLGVDERVALASGDCLAEIPVKADFYLLKGVLQQHNDAGALAILRNCCAAMSDGARLVIIERLLPVLAEDDPVSIMLALHMMTITGGRVRTLPEFEALLVEASLVLSQATPTRSGLSVLEAAHP
jgi:hypothetical protein